MKRAAALPLMVAFLAGCAGHDRLTAIDTRDEQVEHRQLQVGSGAGAGAIEPYQLRPSEGYRMPQLHTAPPPVVGARDPRRNLAPTMVCLQVVVDATGAVERSLPLSNRDECKAGLAAENTMLLQAAQEAVAKWEFTPAAVCHFAAGVPVADPGDCNGAEHVEPVPVSLLYAFTFEIVQGRQYVRKKE
ncbi:hypothetical protein GCM10027214_30250 [Stenotrophomonas tumulicola]